MIGNGATLLRVGARLMLFFALSALAAAGLAQTEKTSFVGKNVAASLRNVDVRSESGRKVDLLQQLRRAPLNLLVLYRGVW